MAKAKAAKAPKAPREVRRNVPSIDLALNIVKISVTTILGIGLTFLCTWFYYMAQNKTAEVYTIELMMEYIDKNILYMSAVVVCGLILWATIGFIISTLIVKAIKYFLNYK